MHFYSGTLTVKYSGDSASELNFKQEEIGVSAKLFYEPNANWKQLCLDFTYPNLINRGNVCFDLHNWSSQFDDLMLYHVMIDKLGDSVKLCGGIVLTTNDSVEHFEIEGLFN